MALSWILHINKISGAGKPAPCEIVYSSNGVTIGTGGAATGISI